MSIHFPTQQLFPGAERRPDPADPKHFHPITRLVIIGVPCLLFWCVAALWIAGLL